MILTINNLNNISPQIYSLSAIVVGYLLINDTSINEQNAIGNWLMLIAQMLCTNSQYQQINNNIKKDVSTKETLNMINKMIKALQLELNNIKSKK